jgi:hypothetical protein
MTSLLVCLGQTGLTSERGRLHFTVLTFGAVVSKFTKNPKLVIGVLGGTETMDICVYKMKREVRTRRHYQYI